MISPVKLDKLHAVAIEKCENEWASL